MVLCESSYRWLLFVCKVMEFTLSSRYVAMQCIQFSGTSCQDLLHIGKGVPNRLASVNSHTQPVSSQDIPSVDEATQQFEGMGGNLTLFSLFGKDLLAEHPELLAERDRRYYSAYPDFAIIFHEISNGRTQLFEGGLQLFLQLTEQLAQNLP